MKRYHVTVETTKTYQVIVEANSSYDIKKEVLDNWKDLLTDDFEEDFYIGKITDVSDYKDYDDRNEGYSYGSY